MMRSERHLEQKKITDSHLEILSGEETSGYHMECESGAYDDSLLVKLFEYVTQIAVDCGEAKGLVQAVAA
ncbi:MAG: hypothetical protein E7294_05530 [Lachnospiraceae bacterium]|jgi:hypothetical protein|nr:hypothetical protein [Lachnospiraceae bacterium]